MVDLLCKLQRSNLLFVGQPFEPLWQLSSWPWGLHTTYYFFPNRICWWAWDKDIQSIYFVALSPIFWGTIFHIFFILTADAKILYLCHNRQYCKKSKKWNPAEWLFLPGWQTQHLHQFPGTLSINWTLDWLFGLVGLKPCFVAMYLCWCYQYKVFLMTKMFKCVLLNVLPHCVGLLQTRGLFFHFACIFRWWKRREWSIWSQNTPAVERYLVRDSLLEDSECLCCYNFLSFYS